MDEGYFLLMDRKKWYILGSFFANYLPCKGGILYRDANRDLVSYIKEEIGCDTAIIKTPRKESYAIIKRKTPILLKSLSRHGCEEAKADREFPDVPEEHLFEFVRGFFDAKVHFHDQSNAKIRFEEKFLVGLEERLRDTTKRKIDVEDRLITFQIGDLKRIVPRLYDNPTHFISDIRLKLVDTAFRKRSYYLGMREERSKQAHELLTSGLHPYEVHEIVGYKKLETLNIAYKHVYGMTMFEYAERISVEKAKDMFNSGINLNEAAKTLGICRDTLRHRFKRVTGATVADYKATI